MLNIELLFFNFENIIVKIKKTANVTNIYLIPLSTLADKPKKPNASA